MYVSNGVEITGRSIQWHLEANPDHVCAKLDVRNAFNECSRAAMMHELRHAHGGALSGVLPLFVVLYGRPNRLHVRMAPGEDPACFSAEEGVTQGCPLAGLAFDAAIQPSLRRAAASLRAVGGFAVAIQDDIHLLGPLESVAAAFRQLVGELREHCGLRANPRKTALLTLGAELGGRRSAEARLAELFSCEGAGEKPTPAYFDRATPAAERGFIAVGIPVGTPEYVAAAVARLARAASEHLPHRIANHLGDHFQVAQLLLRKCAVPSLMFLVRALPPSLCLAAAEAFDVENVRCMLALLRLGPSMVAPGSSAWLQTQLPIGGGSGGLGVTSLAALTAAAHVASIEASQGYIVRICPTIAAAFAVALPTDGPAGLFRPPIAGTPAPIPSLLRFFHALAALPTAAYQLLCGARASAQRHGGAARVGGGSGGGSSGGASGSGGGGARPPPTERTDERGLQHRLSVHVIARQVDAFVRQLEAEALGQPQGTLQAWKAQALSFAGGGGVWMETWGEVAGMMAWHARAFLRLVLRQPPEGISAAVEWAAWRCEAEGCSCVRTESGIAAIAHAGSCGETTRRHNAYARAVRAVAHAFPGQPQIRVEASGIPDAASRMDLVVSGAATPAAGEPGSPPDGRTLLIDVSITEPLGARPMSRGSHTTANVAAAIRRKEKETRYGAVVDTERHKLVPWAVETWGRHDDWLVKFLRGVAEIAATDRERPSCGDDAAERRRVARLRETIFATWMQRLGAGLAVAVAEHFDARFRPLRGTVARQGGRAHVPAGMEGACALDQGLLGVGGHARCMEPLHGFFMRCC
jgi:uncharacterized membrane protein YgcG